MLPRLMERAGTSDHGSITAIYTVLVDGGDFDDRLDAARGILDGHILLSRDLAAKNHYPCIDIGHSVSRLFSVVSSEEHKVAAGRLKKYWQNMKKQKILLILVHMLKGAILK